MRQVFVLLWKHTLVRGRNVSSVCDYIAPVIMVMWLHFLEQTITSKIEKETMEFSGGDLRQNSGSVLYSPESELTDRLMMEVGAKLNLKRLYHLPNKQERGYFPFSRETSMSILKYSRDDMRSEDAIVIFENMESYSWPDTLNYTIRMKTNFISPIDPEPYHMYKQKSLNIFNLLGTNENSGMHTFLRLQWAIDTSYLQLTTGAYVDQILALQEFPTASNRTPEQRLVVFVLASMFLPLAIMAPVIGFTQRIYEEKISGVHELQKISGVSAETIALSHVLDMVSVLLVNILVFVLYFKLAGHVIITSWVHPALAIALYFFTVIAFSFIVFYLLDLSSALIGGLLMWGIMMGFWIIIMATMSAVRDRTLVLLLYHIPLQAYSGFWMSLGVKELS